MEALILVYTAMSKCAITVYYMNSGCVEPHPHHTLYPSLYNVHLCSAYTGISPNDIHLCEVGVQVFHQFLSCRGCEWGRI